MKFFYLEQVDSTNKFAKENIKSLEDKTVIYTFNQTNGRGRLNRSWEYTGKDNIYATIVLKPSNKMEEKFSNLTQYLCVQLSKLFEEYGIKPVIKWPNDILVNSKKISGILAEGVIEGDRLEGLVLGFGINLNTTKETLDRINQPATSLNIETGNFIEPQEFLKKLLSRFCLGYDNFIAEGFSSIKEEYLKRFGFMQKEVTIRQPNRDICGIITDISDNGAIKLKLTDGKFQEILIGDILN